MKKDICTEILAELALIIGIVFISSVLLIVWQEKIQSNLLVSLVFGIFGVVFYVIAKISQQQK